MTAIPITASTNNSLRRRTKMGILEALAGSSSDQLAPRALLARRYDIEIAKRDLAKEQRTLDRGLEKMKQKLAEAEARFEAKKQLEGQEGEKGADV